jgi:hypothetical protein
VTINGMVAIATLAIALATPLRSNATAQAQVSVDTVRVSRAVLGRALDDPRACVSPDAGRGVWPALPSVVQAGSSLVLDDGRVTVMDLDAGTLRVYATDGREIAALGRRGAGPGEFGARAQPMRWSGDTIAVADPDNSRIVLFTGGRYAATINLAQAGSMARSVPKGRDPRGGLLYVTGQAARADLGSPFRPPYRLVRWNPYDATPVAEVLRDGILGTEFHVVPGPERPVFATVNFARTTWAAALKRGIAVYDDAHPVVAVLNWHGQIVRALVIDVSDPPVTVAQRDSVLRRVAAFPSPVQLPELDAARRWIPATRAAARWHGTDAGDGVWLGFSGAVAKGHPVFVRFSATGEPTHCYRTSPDTRAVAFAPDRVITIAERDEGDAINAERIVAYPGGR